LNSVVVRVAQCLFQHDGRTTKEAVGLQCSRV